MIKIQKYGYRTAATLPLCLREWEDQLKKGNNIINATLGAGFIWVLCMLSGVTIGKM